MLLVTLDTDQLDNSESLRLIRDAINVRHHLAVVTITRRERGDDVVLAELDLVPETAVWGESRWDEALWFGSVVPETFVLDESKFDEVLLGGMLREPDLEQILRIISSGSFPSPGDREGMNEARRHQLRDAMILQAHARERRHLLISGDNKAFRGPDGAKRSELESLCGTRIMDRPEFFDFARRGLLGTLEL